MRWHEIATDKTPEQFRGFLKEADAKAKARETLLSIIAPLSSQNVNRITLQQVLDILQQDPQLQGIQLDARFVMDAAKSIPAITSIRPDADARGELTLFLDTPKGDRQVDARTAEKEKQNIHKAAMRSISKRKK